MGPKTESGIFIMHTAIRNIVHSLRMKSLLIELYLTVVSYLHTEAPDLIVNTNVFK